MRLTWPTSDIALMLWAQLLLAWVIATYYVGRTSSIWGRVKHDMPANWVTQAVPRLLVLFVATLLLYGAHMGRALVLSAVGCGLTFLLTYAREHGKENWRKLGAEFELGFTGAFVLLSAVIVGDVAIPPRFAIVKLPLSESRIAALAFTLGVVGFLIRGGTQVVRAILNKANASQPDEAEYNRGRLIGSIERVLLLGMVATGNWAALGFTIAAKSLVRSKEFEQSRDFAEYFLIGTLTSTTLAIVAGGLVRIVFVNLW